MATPEPGHIRPGPAEAGGSSVVEADQRGDEQAAAELLAMRRLGEADAFVRTGLAVAEEGAIRLPAGDAAGGVSLAIPLPPAALEPVLRLEAATGRPPLTPALLETIRAVLNDALPGTLSVAPEEGAVELTWRPAGPHAAAEASRRARAAAEQLALAARDAAARGEWSAALSLLESRLVEHRGRAERLARSFRDHALLRLPGIGVLHLLAHRIDPHNPAAPRLVVVQSDPDLLAPSTGRGALAAFRLPEWGTAPRLERLARGLCKLLRRRLRLSVSPSESLELLGEWAEPQHTMLLSIDESDERTFDDLLWQLADFVRFAEGVVHWATLGHSPFELLGIVDPGPQAALADDHADVAPEAPAAASQPAPEPDPAVVASEHTPTARRPVPGPPMPRTKGSPKPATQPTPPDAPAGPTAWGRPIPAPSRRRAENIDKLTAREVVKKLGLQEEADVDVFMSHAGYNPQKTVDIMALAVGVSREEAQRIVDSAPTLVIGPVTRTRAARAKTILEGTGATIRIVPTGDNPVDEGTPSEDEPDASAEPTEQPPDQD